MLAKTIDKLTMGFLKPLDSDAIQISTADQLVLKDIVLDSQKLNSLLKSNGIDLSVGGAAAKRIQLKHNIMNNTSTLKLQDLELQVKPNTRSIIKNLMQSWKEPQQHPHQHHPHHQHPHQQHPNQHYYHQHHAHQLHHHPHHHQPHHHHHPHHHQPHHHPHHHQHHPQRVPNSPNYVAPHPAPKSGLLNSQTVHELALNFPGQRPIGELHQKPSPLEIQALRKRGLSVVQIDDVPDDDMWSYQTSNTTKQYSHITIQKKEQNKRKDTLDLHPYAQENISNGSIMTPKDISGYPPLFLGHIHQEHNMQNNWKLGKSAGIGGVPPVGELRSCFYHSVDTGAVRDNGRDSLDSYWKDDERDLTLFGDNDNMAQDPSAVPKEQRPKKHLNTSVINPPLTLHSVPSQQNEVKVTPHKYEPLATRQSPANVVVNINTMPASGTHQWMPQSPQSTPIGATQTTTSIRSTGKELSPPSKPKKRAPQNRSPTKLPPSVEVSEESTVPSRGSWYGSPISNMNTKHHEPHKVHRNHLASSARLTQHHMTCSAPGLAQVHSLGYRRG